MGVSLGKQSEMQHIWLFKVIDDLLLTHSLKSVPELEQGAMLSAALEFPLQREVMNDDTPRWPNPVIHHPNDRDASPAIGVRIAQLIAAVGSSNGGSRAAPLVRLLPLATKAGFLTQTERERLAAALWGESPDYQVLPETGLHPHALLLLPVMDVARAEALVRTHLYGHGVDVLENTQGNSSYPSPEVQRAILIYEGIAQCGQLMTRCACFQHLEQALILFDRLVIWRPSAATESPFQLAGSSRKQLAESIGHALLLRDCAGPGWTTRRAILV